jgi:multicomponent K+:H+ antiporter subunit E
VIRRVLPNPLISGVILVVWLLLNGPSAGQLLLGLVLALSIPVLVAPLKPDRPRIRRPARAALLFAIVLYDIVKAAIDLAILILGPESRVRSTYFWVPIELRDPYAIAALAGIITMTPGTLSSDLSPDRRHLLVHCFHTDDVDATIAEIKDRYERRLKEIFE